MYRQCTEQQDCCNSQQLYAQVKGLSICLHKLFATGWDFINSAEATAGEVMSAAGYRTAQFGKWHNREVSGYEPWSVGFHEGQLPPVNKDCPVK
jgi:hypothetical protein